MCRVCVYVGLMSCDMCTLRKQFQDCCSDTTTAQLTKTKCDHRLRLQVNPGHDIDEVPDNEDDTADAVGLFDKM